MSLTVDVLDQYYTPSAVADEILGAAPSGSSRVVDTACGEGSLLEAAQRLDPTTRCVGVDRDDASIRRLRRKKKAWVLSAGDMLNDRTIAKTNALVAGRGCDLLVLNPPFSIRGARTVAASFQGEVHRCSVAMAHVLRSFELFAPRLGAVAVVPESLLFSETDANARDALAARFKLRVLRELENTTFSGARAHSALIQIVPGGKRRAPRRRGGLPAGPELVRGGLPLFQAVDDRSGVPLIHSQDISKLSAGGPLAGFRTVSPIGRGLVSGAVVLIPRVGVPLRSSLRAVFLRRRIQLSDCVIAIRLPSIAEARHLASSLQDRHESLCGVYHGTGARFVTLQRLQAWLAACEFSKANVGVLCDAGR